MHKRNSGRHRLCSISLTASCLTHHLKPFALVLITALSALSSALTAASSQPVVVPAPTVFLNNPGMRHSTWSTPGGLVEVEFPTLVNSNKNTHELAPVELVSGLPDGAVLLDNEDGSRTFYWVPSISDIGSSRVSVKMLDGFDGSTIALHQLRVEVLEVESSKSRLNRRPKLEIQSGLDTHSNGGIHRLVPGKPFEILATAIDDSGRAPVLNVQGLPATASIIHEGDASQRIRWVPGEDEIGFGNIRVYAVDAEVSGQYELANINLLVENEELELSVSGSWLDQQLDNQNDYRLRGETRINLTGID